MKKIGALLAAFCLVFSAFSQDFELTWSDVMQYQNKRDGFYNKIVGSTDERIYVLFKGFSLSGMSDSYIKLVAFNKQTLTQVASVPIKGYKENAPDKIDYRGLDFMDVVVLNENIYVFWTKLINTRNDKREELYAESFNMNLDRKERLKEVITANYDANRKLSSSASLMTVLANADAGEQFVVGYEVQREGNNVEYHYTLVNADFEMLDKQSVSLPIVSNAHKTRGKSSVYELGSDGNIYIRSSISRTREELRSLPKGTPYGYSVFTALNPENNQMTSFDLTAENISINDFSYKIVDDRIKIFAFFCDLTKDPKGHSTHGIAHSEIIGETLESSPIELIYFDKSFISKLFKGDEEDKKRTSGSRKKKEKNRENDEESLDTRYVIENLFVNDDKSVVLFCSKMYNYSVTTCTNNPNGGQTCTTRYYCQKSNVTAIRITAGGEIDWATNLDRLITYSGWDAYDLNVTRQGDKFYVIYGSSFSVEADVKNRKSRKKTSEMRDSFEYAVFDAASGKFEKNTFQVNQSGTEKKDRRMVNPLMIREVDGDFYVNYMKVKPMSYLCCGYIVMMAPGTVKADGYIGRISVIDGEGGKKKRRGK